VKKTFLNFSLFFLLFSIFQISYAEEWISLFDGKTLNGWKASEHPDSLKVIDGAIACAGPRAHLFYVGEVQEADFKNFELKAQIKTTPGANSGIYFHTQYQDQGYPFQGYEVQINNTHLGSGNYRELKKTGSLYGIRNQYKSIVDDNEWFDMHIIVNGKRIQIFVNQTLLVDYTEPDEPVKSERRQGRYLSHGTFAIQCHDPESRVYFKNIEVKPLPDDAIHETEPSLVDETYKDILDLNLRNFPIVDFHVHLKGGLTLEEALAK